MGPEGGWVGWIPGVSLCCAPHVQVLIFTCADLPLETDTPIG